MMKGMLLLLALVAATAAAAAAADTANLTTPINIDTLRGLRQSLFDSDNGLSKKIGFVTRGDYQSVSTKLAPPQPEGPLEVVLTKDIDEMAEAVRNGTLLAGLVAGLPPNEDNVFHEFSSGVISPRAILFSPPRCGFEGANPLDSTDLIEAIDAAIVMAHDSGEDVRVAESNPPFSFVAAHTCKAGVSYPFVSDSRATGLLETVLEKRVLTVAAIGQLDKDYGYDWKEDGNYEVTPPVGFWPEFLDAIFLNFQNMYGSDIVLERKWYPSSMTVLDAVMNGEADMTEPYFAVDAFYEFAASGKSVSRKSAFGMSCTLLGYDSTFFTLKFAE